MIKFKKNIKTCLVLLLTTVLLLGGNFVKPNLAHAAGTTYYVSPSGVNDYSHGWSANNPFQTIAYGVSRMSPGDTLLIMNGTYNEEVQIEDKKGTDSSWYTISNYNNDTPTLNGNNTTDYAFGVSRSSHLKITGLNISNYLGAGVWLKGACDNVIMSNLDISNLNPPNASVGSGTEGILAGDSTYCTVDNCKIHGIGMNYAAQNRQRDHGIYLNTHCDHWTISNNIINNVAGSGIQSLSGDPNDHRSLSNSSIIYNYICGACNCGGILLYDEAQNNLIASNVFYNNGPCDLKISTYNHPTSISTNNRISYNKFASWNKTSHLMFDCMPLVGNFSFDYNTYYLSDSDLSTLCLYDCKTSASATSYLPNGTYKFPFWKNYQEPYGTQNPDRSAVVADAQSKIANYK